MLDAKRLEGVHRSDDVDDRVEGTDFVQMDLVESHSVNRSFCFTESSEQVAGAGLSDWAQRRPVNESSDFGQSPMSVVLRVIVVMMVIMIVHPSLLAAHLELRRRHASSGDALGPHGIAVDREGSECTTEIVEWQPRIEQRAEDHVA